MSEEQNPSLRIAYIDVNYILNQSKEVRELRKKQAEKEQDLKVWISKVNTDVIKRGNPEEQQNLVNRYNEEFLQKQQKLREEYSRKLQEIDKNITKIIAEKAKKLHYDFVLAKGTILFGGEDITLQIAEQVR